jgi:hypothetical protein
MTPDYGSGSPLRAGILVHREFEASGQTAYYREFYTTAIGTAAAGYR